MFIETFVEFDNCLVGRLLHFKKVVMILPHPIVNYAER